MIKGNVPMIILGTFPATLPRLLSSLIVVIHLTLYFDAKLAVPPMLLDTVLTIYPEKTTSPGDETPVTSEIRFHCSDSAWPCTTKLRLPSLKVCTSSEPKTRVDKVACHRSIPQVLCILHTYAPPPLRRLLLCTPCAFQSAKSM